MDCVGEGRVKWKILVSWEMGVLEDSRARRQVLGWRKTLSWEVFSSDEVGSEGEVRGVESVPMW
jgi:hypothetical protein